MSVTAIGSQSPGGENTVSSQATEVTGTTDFLEILLEGSSPAETHNANQAAGPVTGKLLSLLPDVEQGTETDHVVTTAESGVHGLVPAEAMAAMSVVSSPGADTRAPGTSVSAPTSVAGVEGPGPSHPITALPSHVLGSDPAAPGASLLTASAAGGAPAGAAASMASVTGAAPLVSPAHGLEPAITATAPAPAPVVMDAPVATPASAAIPAAGAGNVAVNVAQAAPGALLPVDALAILADAATATTETLSPAGAPPAVVPGPQLGADDLVAPTMPMAPASPTVIPDTDTPPVPSDATAPASAPVPHEASAPPTGLPVTAALSPDVAPAVPVLGPSPISAGMPGVPSAPAPSPHAALDIMRQVADALHVSIRRGDDVLRMQMRPAELGTVVIHLVQRDGQLHAHVRADSPESVQALEQALSGLVDVLQSQGQSLGGLDVALRQAHEERELFSQMQGERRGSSGENQSPSGAPVINASSPTSTSVIDFHA